MPDQIREKKNKFTYAMLIIVVVIIIEYDIIITVRHFFLCPISLDRDLSLYFGRSFAFISLYSQGNNSDLNLIGQNTNVRLAPQRHD